ncbi:AraC family transcriptional regulator [Chitinispirillum alkaliphilum]|nr:AraC family transcriptional regulator [Chitinispirillum alkaliphilum]
MIIQLFIAFILTICFSDVLGHFPGDDALWSSFGDSGAYGGSGTVELSVDSNRVVWVFRLEGHNRYPYVGLMHHLHVKPESARRYSENDSLVIHMRSNRSGHLHLQLATYDPVYTSSEDPSSYRVLETSLYIAEKTRRFSVPLGQFRVANWWKLQYGAVSEDHDLHLDSLTRIDWVFSDTSRIGQADTLILENLYFVSNSKKNISLLWPLFLIALLASIVILRLLRKKEKPQSGTPKSGEIESDTKILQPKPIETGPTEWQRVLDYFQKNYSNSELNLKKAANELGFSESRLSRLIRNNHQEGFRSLIHDLRIEEAKRLLSETDFNIAEIAYTIGYATPNHFNREFKQRLDVTPTKYRNQRSGQLTGEPSDGEERS